VMLAGRKIGTVESIQSPVAVALRPPGRPESEAMITVQVSSDAEIYKANDVTMRTFGLLSEYVIDFTNGDPNSGRAATGDSFVGSRVPDLGEVGPVIIKKLDPVLKEATSTFSELRRTLQNLTELTAKDSKLLTGLDKTLDNFRLVGGNLKTLTDKGGPVDSTLSGVQTTLQSAQTTLNGVQEITGQVTKDNNLQKALVNLNGSSERLKSILAQVQGACNTVLSNLNGMSSNLNEVSLRLKIQPWRIIWPNTIKYPEKAGSPPKRPRKAQAQD
jgi:ABC-type transporter Mla subunit MlaD